MYKDISDRLDAVDKSFDKVNEKLDQKERLLENLQ